MEYTSKKQLLKILNGLLEEEFNKFEQCNIELVPTSKEICLSNTRTCYGSNKRTSTKCPERVIYISINFIDIAHIEEIRTVIAHELAHSTAGSTGHDEKWKETINIIRQNYDYLYADYHFHEHPYSKERVANNHSIMREKEHKYELKCISCGNKYFYQKKTKAVLHPEKYRCGKCGGILINYDRKK